MEDDFDINDVHRLVDEVLGGAQIERAPQPRNVTTRVPFGVYDTDIIENLYVILDKLPLHQGDVQMVLDELRNKLTQDLDLGFLPDLHSLTLNCRRCPELKDPTLPFGNLRDPDIIFVSDTPLVDWPPELFSLIEQSGINVNRIMMTFATRCSARRAPTATELDNCYTYLYPELQMLTPKLIIPLGATAAGQFINPLKISEDHGIIYWIGPWAIMPMFALGYLTRKENAEKEFLVDLTKAKNFLYG